MALQPPSFFEAPQHQSHREWEEGHSVGGTVRSQYGGAVTVGPASSQDEIVALRQENQELKKCLRSFGHPPPAHELPTSPCVHHPNPTTVPVLTNDLLQVEANLQSRMRSLEREKREVSLQLLELERMLYQTKEHYEGQMGALRSQNEEALLQIQLENERLSSEYQTLQEEKASRIKVLEDEVAAVREQSASEVEAMQARVADMEERNRALRSELEEEKVVHGRELSEVRRQLVVREGEVEQARREAETQVSTLQRELSSQSEHVQQLEAYLGGELPSEDSRVTWREERDILTTRIRDQEREGERLQSEAKLLNIRLASLSEILTIQETDTAKHMANGSSGEGGAGSVKSLLSRWREKVFVLLVQQKLQQIQDNRERLEARSKEQCLMGQQRQLEVEKELLSHALADKTAELQLHTSKTEELEHRLNQACCTIRELEGQLQCQHEGAQHVGSCVQRMAEGYGHCKALFDQALTRLANYEQRLVFVSRRVNSVNASLSCHFAILGHQPVHTATMDATCQTEQEEVRERLDLTSFSREQLDHEVTSLTRERDALVKKLSDSTVAFEQQLQSVNQTCTLRVSVLEERVSRLQREKESVSERLSEVVGRQSAVEEEKDSLQEKVGQLEGQLRDTQATVKAQLEAAVLEQQQRSGEALSEMEGLLNVAKREHTKAVVQLQQLQRQVGRERERAMHAAEMSKAQVEHELESCQRKLQTVQAERNLLLTTLRLEGIVVPSKRPVPRPALVTAHYSEQDSESEYESIDGSTSAEASSLSHQHITPPGGGESQSGMEEDPIPSSVYQRKETATGRESVTHQAGLLQDSNSEMTVNGSTAVDAGDHMEASEVEAGHEDIREVLKDLQLLSASLLGLETRTVTES